MTEFNEYQFGLELVKLIDDYSDREKTEYNQGYLDALQPFQVITMKRAMNKNDRDWKNYRFTTRKIRYFKSIKTLKYNY